MMAQDLWYVSYKFCKGWYSLKASRLITRLAEESLTPPVSLTNREKVGNNQVRISIEVGSVLFVLPILMAVNQRQLG
jgi:hypothetical protein